MNYTLTPRAFLHRFYWVAAFMLPAAHATPVTADLPQAIDDRQLSIGARTLSLPDGRWSLVARGQSTIKQDQGLMDRSTHYTAYAMDVREGRMQGALVLRLPESSTTLSRWIDDPCKVDGALFKDELNSNPRTPQCLVVFKRRSHLATSTDAFYGQARQWATAQNVVLPGPVYEVAYTNLAQNDFGLARVFFTQTAVAGDDAAIAWAKQLPLHLQRFFEGREGGAALPALPGGKVR